MFAFVTEHPFILGGSVTVIVFLVTLTWVRFSHWLYDASEQAQTIKRRIRLGSKMVIGFDTRITELSLTLSQLDREFDQATRLREETRQANRLMRAAPVMPVRRVLARWPGAETEPPVGFWFEAFVVNKEVTLAARRDFAGCQLSRDFASPTPVEVFAPDMDTARAALAEHYPAAGGYSVTAVTMAPSRPFRGLVVVKRRDELPAFITPRIGGELITTLSYTQSDGILFMERGAEGARIDGGVGGDGRYEGGRGDPVDAETAAMDAVQ